MPSNATRTTPSPSVWPVIMVALQQMPIRAHTTPMALLIAGQDTQSVQVKTNTLGLAPTPANSTMQTVIVMVAAVDAPELSDDDPTRTSPAPLHSQAIPMTVDTPRCTPTPTIWSVVFVSFPEVPVRTHFLPLALDIPPQNPQPIPVKSDTPEATESPSSLSVQTVFEMIAAMKVPKLPDDDPTNTSPSVLDSQTIQVTTNASGTSPAPAVGLVVVVFLPQVPV